MADITFNGNATADAELRFTKGGQAVLNVDVAENHRKRDQQGNWSDDGTTFYRVAVWGALAEAMASRITKGQRLLIAGRFRGGEFEARDGQRVRTYEVNANQVGLIPKRDQQQGGQYQQGGYAPPPDQQGGSWGQNPGAQQGDPWADSTPQQGQQWGGGQDEEPPFK